MSKYDIIVTEEKVRINNLVTADKQSFPREGYKFQFKGDRILLTGSTNSIQEFSIVDISDVNSITDDRSGGPGPIAVPATLELLFDILDDADSPFFFSTTDINATIGDIDLNTDNLENLLQGINGSVETPFLYKLTDGPNTITDQFFAVSITNVGENDGVLLGEVFSPGEQIEYAAKTGNVIGNITYDTTTDGGTTFLIVATKILP